MVLNRIRSGSVRINPIQSDFNELLIRSDSIRNGSNFFDSDRITEHKIYGPIRSVTDQIRGYESDRFFFGTLHSPHVLEFLQLYYTYHVPNKYVISVRYLLKSIGYLICILYVTNILLPNMY